MKCPSDLPGYARETRARGDAILRLLRDSIMDPGTLVYSKTDLVSRRASGTAPKPSGFPKWRSRKVSLVLTGVWQSTWGWGWLPRRPPTWSQGRGCQPHPLTSGGGAAGRPPTWSQERGYWPHPLTSGGGATAGPPTWLLGELSALPPGLGRRGCRLDPSPMADISSIRLL